MSTIISQSIQLAQSPSMPLILYKQYAFFPLSPSPLCFSPLCLSILPYLPLFPLKQILFQMPPGPTKITTTQDFAHIWGLTSNGTIVSYNEYSCQWEEVPSPGVSDIIQLNVHLSSSGPLQVVYVDTIGHGWMYVLSLSFSPSFSLPPYLFTPPRYVYLQIMKLMERQV